jgi:hypothetical protein
MQVMRISTDVTRPRSTCWEADSCWAIEYLFNIPTKCTDVLNTYYIKSLLHVSVCYTHHLQREIHILAQNHMLFTVMLCVCVCYIGYEYSRGIRCTRMENFKISGWASQAVPRILWNKNFYCLVHKSSPLVLVLIYVIPVRHILNLFL